MSDHIMLMMGAFLDWLTSTSLSQKMPLYNRQQHQHQAPGILLGQHSQSEFILVDLHFCSVH
jgi:hypothetical protein